MLSRPVRPKYNYKFRSLSSSAWAPKSSDEGLPDNDAIDGMVTRLLDRQEALNNPKALEAIHNEADGLVGKGTWGLETVREYDDVVSEARRTGKKVHIGGLMTICSEKIR